MKTRQHKNTVKKCIVCPLPYPVDNSHNYRSFSRPKSSRFWLENELHSPTISVEKKTFFTIFDVQLFRTKSKQKNKSERGENEWAILLD
jgi:hypothetical protein